MTMLDGVTMNERTREQAENVLKLMRPYSISKFLEAIDNGRVEGYQYTNADNDDTYEDYQGFGSTRRLKTQEFVGCMLGWAGFLERIAQSKLWAKLANRTGANETDAIEGFVLNIHQGKTPQNSPYAAELRRVVVSFQKRVASGQVEIPKPKRGRPRKVTIED